jgi:tRNA (guanine37-N1)-methyltransferase
VQKFALRKELEERLLSKLPEGLVACRLRIDILSLFPAYFRGPFDESIIGRAKEAGILSINLVDIRDFAEGKHKRVDDRPYGGGPGMVLMPEPVAKAIKSSSTPKAHVVYLSPQGSVLTAEKCRQLAQMEHLVLLCGHYEGIDERVIAQEVDEEISIGDYVLTNGCLAAIVLVDALSRFLPGVLGHQEAAEQDSFQNGILDCPHYTRPPVYEGMEVPKVLQEGNHEAIRLWRREEALRKTKRVRPDLLELIKPTF